jgi:hypothetical protein
MKYLIFTVLLLSACGEVTDNPPSPTRGDTLAPSDLGSPDLATAGSGGSGSDAGQRPETPAVDVQGSEGASTSAPDASDWKNLPACALDRGTFAVGRECTATCIECHANYTDGTPPTPVPNCQYNSKKCVATCADC